MTEESKHEPEEDIFDCDCESCTRRQRAHIKKMSEMVE